MADAWDNLYPIEAQSSDLWTGPTSSGIEIDLREELKRTLYGAGDEVAKGRIGLLRRMRLDSNGLKIKCSCRDTITDEPDKDMYCRVCIGIGYLWDEEKLVYYKNDDTLRKSDESFFYVEYSVKPSQDDYVVELIRDTEGAITSPGIRQYLYKIIAAEPYRSDTGRIEYWRCRAKYERVWSVWYGATPRQHEPSAGS